MSVGLVVHHHRHETIIHQHELLLLLLLLLNKLFVPLVQLQQNIYFVDFLLFVLRAFPTRGQSQHRLNEELVQLRLAHVRIGEPFGTSLVCKVVVRLVRVYLEFHVVEVGPLNEGLELLVVVDCLVLGEGVALKVAVHAH